MSDRKYQMVMPEITTSLFLCPDCGSIVWYAGRDLHDEWHYQAAGQVEQVEALISTSRKHTDLLDADEQRLDEHSGQIVDVQTKVGDLESSVYRLNDALRDVGYRADEAQRAAERAADSAGRGWRP